MKTYIVYVNGMEVGTIEAASHNAAEKKAKNKYGDGKEFPDTKKNVSVEYTEI